MTATAGAATAAAVGFPPVYIFPTMFFMGIIMAYLLGSIPFGILLAKRFNVGDLTKIGSGNIGATNMLRAGGKKLAAATLALDMLKGYLAVKLGYTLFVSHLEYILNRTDSNIHFEVHNFIYFFGLWAVIGHVFPVWLKGKGGKGVATALGALVAFSPAVGILSLGIWLITFAVTSYSSLSALISIGLSPFICAYFLGKGSAIAAIGIALIVILRHKENIQRLSNGTETKSNIGKKA